jgi:hypothetical protein
MLGLSWHHAPALVVLPAILGAAALNAKLKGWPF